MEIKYFVKTNDGYSLLDIELKNQERIETKQFIHPETGKLISYQELSKTEYTDHVFSISGIRFDNDLEIISCGQCYDDADDNDLPIHKIWKDYHLNDLKAGLPVQEEFLKNNSLMKSNYLEAKKELQSANLYEVDGYRYGSGWLQMILPQEIIVMAHNMKTVQDEYIKEVNYFKSSNYNHLKGTIILHNNTLKVYDAFEDKVKGYKTVFGFGHLSQNEVKALYKLTEEKDKKMNQIVNETFNKLYLDQTVEKEFKKESSKTMGLKM